MNTLSSQDWSAEALALIKEVNRLPLDTNAILFLRHSHRLDSDDWGAMMDLRITPLGKEVAQEFGAALPENRSYNLFHSPIERCRETALEIQTGLNTIGNSPVFGGMKLYLGEIEGDPDKITQYMKRDKMQFVNRFLAGFYDYANIERPENYAKRAAKGAWGHVLSAPQGQIDIHVSHDITANLLEFLWCGLLRDTYRDWVDFLGGFLLWFGEDELHCFSKGTTYDCPYPVWAKNLKPILK